MAQFHFLIDFYLYIKILRIWIKLIYIKTNGSEEWTNYADEFKVPSNAGLYTVEYKGTDNVGNESSVQSFSCYIDKEPPKTKLEISK